MDSDYKLNLIFNRNIQGIIGINNELFTGISEDFAHFKEKTSNNIVVMGYNTFKSLPGKNKINILSNRLNVVISNNHYDSLVEQIKESNVKSCIMVYKTFDHFYHRLIENKIVYDKDVFKNKDIFIDQIIINF